MDRWKTAQVGRVREERIAVKAREKEEKLQNVVFFPTFCGSREVKSGGCRAIWTDEKIARSRRCGTEGISKSKCQRHLRSKRFLGVEKWQKYTPLCLSAFRNKKWYKHVKVRSAFERSDVQRVCAAVARSTFQSQNAQNASGWAIWKFRCSKSECRCGPKHISNQNAQNPAAS